MWRRADTTGLQIPRSPAELRRRMLPVSENEAATDGMPSGQTDASATPASSSQSDNSGENEAKFFGAPKSAKNNLPKGETIC
jgi:hypothetical protein